MRSFDFLRETSFPPKEAFLSSLKGEGISDKDYSHGLKVWNTLDCKALGEYGLNYCTVDLLQLADIWFSFVDECMTDGGLEPSYYLKAPSLSMHTRLKEMDEMD